VLKWRRAKSPSGEASFRRGFHVGQCDCFIFRSSDGDPVDRYDVILGGFVDFGNIIDVCDLVDISNLVDVRDVVLAIGGGSSGSGGSGSSSKTVVSEVSTTVNGMTTTTITYSDGTTEVETSPASSQASQGSQSDRPTIRKALSAPAPTRTARRPRAAGSERRSIADTRHGQRDAEPSAIVLRGTRLLHDFCWS